MSLNKILLIGRLGQDPEVKNFPSGESYCNFSIATSKKWKDKNGQPQEKTEWHRIVVYGKMVEVCKQYLSKGNQVYIEGEIMTRRWKDKDGSDRSMVEIVSNSIQFLETNKNLQGQQAKYEKTENLNYTEDGIPMINSTDELPF
jgi:single-strand DNA-binding protein